MPRYVLYQRDDCHLCDQALEVLAGVRLPEPDSVFIDGDDALEACYGVRVPVLRDATDGRAGLAVRRGPGARLAGMSIARVPALVR